MRVLTHNQDGASAELAAHLVAIADRALEDRLAAEQIVAGLCRLQAGLMTAATQSAMADQREAAQAELERLVRRAALDALPPVITHQLKAPDQQAPKTAAQKVGAPVAPPARAMPQAAPDRPAPVRPATIRPASVRLAEMPKPAALAEAPAEPAADGSRARPLGRRPAGQPSGLGELSSTAELSGAFRPRGSVAVARGAATKADNAPAGRGRWVEFAAVVGVIVALGVVGFGYLTSGYLTSAPDQPTVADVPAGSTTVSSPAIDTAAGEAPSLDDAAAAVALQLEAVEPASGPLQEQPAGPGASSAPADPPAGGAPAALADNLRIVIHYQSGSAGSARASNLSSTLDEIKDPLAVELRSVDFTIASPRIRYFYSSDAAAAASLAEVLAPSVNGGGDWQVQDFTHFRPGPSAGTIEVFVPAPGS